MAAGAAAPPCARHDSARIAMQSGGRIDSEAVEKSGQGWLEQKDPFLIPRGGLLLMALLLLSVILAGGRPLWAQGVITMCIGTLWFVWPPLRAPRREIVWMTAALAVAPLTAWLPKTLFFHPLWRKGLEALPALQSSPFVTPQPWFTFHIWLLWLTGLALVAWCVSQQWDHCNRGALARLFAAGMVAVTAFALYAHSTGHNPTLWQSTDGFGPFLNRNQWGTAMGITGVLTLALIHQSVRRQSKRGVLFWSASLALLTIAVIVNGSRGGLLVLFAGGGAYWMLLGLARKQYHYAAVGISFFLISFALFSISGTALLERFVSSGQAVQAGGEMDFRIHFYRMTQKMLADAPVAGAGLGNFEYILPFYLDLPPLFDRRPIHPESSFLWLVGEGGIVLVLVVAAAFVLLFVMALRIRRSRAICMRTAGLTCSLMLILNGFFEVSGHRIGTLFPVIFLASLALPPADGPFNSRRTLKILRGGGVCLAGIGLIWAVSAFGWIVFPKIQGTDSLQISAGRARESGDIGRAVSLLQTGARLKPYDWGIRWALGAFLLEGGSPDAAWNEFRVAGELLPYMSWTLEREGNFWLTKDPARTAFVWSEALHRASPGRRPSIYAGMLQKSADSPALRAMLLRLYPDNPELEFIRIKAMGSAGVFRMHGLLRQTDNLDRAPSHLVEPIMRYMLNHSLDGELDEISLHHSRAKQLGWRVLAERAARNKHFADALQLYFQYGPRPILPAPINRGDLATVERAAALAPGDITTAVARYQALDAAHQKEDALLQLRRITELPGAPAYIWFLAAREEHKRGNSEEAWKLLQIYETKSKP